jgi:hypothetical protein
LIRKFNTYQIALILKKNSLAFENENQVPRNKLPVHFIAKITGKKKGQTFSSFMNKRTGVHRRLIKEVMIEFEINYG